MEYQSTLLTTGNHRIIARRKRGLFRLWSYQPVGVWEKLQAEGSLYVNRACIDESFRTCHNWMRRQMLKRIPGHEGHFPWWAYPERQDLRSFGFHFSEGHGVCLELQLDASRLLISDYENWHFVMNRWFLYITPEEEVEWDIDQSAHGSNSWPPSKKWRQRTIRSWERVFDLDALKNGGVFPGDHPQLCFEKLELKDVVAVTELRRRWPNKVYLVK